MIDTAQPELKCNVDQLTLQKFNELQFLTLRKEIEETKGRLFLLTVGGAALVPAAKLFASTSSLEEITLLLPLLVCVLVLLFLSENNALMRAGSYILHHIERPLYGYTDQQPLRGPVGWERYLQGGKRWRTRLVDVLAAWAFMLYALGYYIVTAFLAFHWANSRSPELAYLAGGVYAALLLCIASVVLYCFRGNTDPRLSDIGD